MKDELRKTRDLLAELNDKHLSHCATVTRALVLKRIEALDALIAKPMDPKLAEARFLKQNPLARPAGIAEPTGA